MNHFHQNRTCSVGQSQIAPFVTVASLNPNLPYALWTCTALEVVWKDVVKWAFRGSTSFLTFKELLSWLIKNSQHVDLFAVTAWSIWNQRNRVRMHQPSCGLHLLAATAKDRLDEFLSVQPAPRPTPPRQWIQWQAQPQGMVKINFDGAISTKTLSSGIGVVVRA